jgi:hypothetical protein
MHRSRPFVLVILAAAAACSKHDPSEGNDILSQDRTLTAHLESNKDSRRPSVPDACGATTLSAAPSAANQRQADELTQQAGVAEMHGNIDDARSLLRRAAALDGTNKSAAYHLGRTSEALGDRTAAMSAYCRYLALAPTAAESVEARQRVAGLSRLMPHAASTAPDNIAAHGNAVAPVPQPARAQSSVAPRVVASVGSRSTAARSSRRVTQSASVVPSGEARPTSTTTPSKPTDADDARGGAVAGGDVVAAQQPAPTPEPSPVPPRAQRRSSIGVQSAIIGAATGAIFGAATGRSVKSAVIGAAAGGVLGTVVGATTRPLGRSIRS